MLPIYESEMNPDELNIFILKGAHEADMELCKLGARTNIYIKQSLSFPLCKEAYISINSTMKPTFVFQ